MACVPPVFAWLWWHAPLSEVIRSYDGALHDALVIGEQGAAQQLQENFRKRARQWLGMETGEEKPKKRHRVKAFEVLSASDNTMKLSTIFREGWASLRPSPEALEGDPHLWPLVHWVTDHGSEMVSALAYLQYKLKANVVGSYDPPHGCHDDFSHALKLSGNYTYSLLQVVAWNLPYAPFDSGARHNAAKAAMQEYFLAKPTGECPLFEAYLGQVLEDQGASDRHFEPG